MNSFNPTFMPMQIPNAQGFGLMGGRGQTFGNNHQMGIYMHPANIGMMPVMMGMTQEQKNLYYRIQGYNYAKFLYGQSKKEKDDKNKAPAPIATSIPESPVLGELNIKFNKNGYIINIKMDAEEMVAMLLNEYFIKSGTQKSNFKFNGKNLSPSDISSLAEVGLRNNSVIFVS